MSVVFLGGPYREVVGLIPFLIVLWCGPRGSSEHAHETARRGTPARAAFAALPLFTIRSHLLNLGVQIFLAVVLAQSWNLLGGYAGQINLGHAAFFGLGALVTRTLWVGGTPLILALFPGALVAMLFGLIIDVPAFRLRGAYFAIGTLGLAEYCASRSGTYCRRFPPSPPRNLLRIIFYRAII